MPTIEEDWQDDAARLNEMAKTARELGHVDDSLFPPEIAKPPLLNQDGGLLNQPILAGDETDDDDQTDEEDE